MIDELRIEINELESQISRKKIELNEKRKAVRMFQTRIDNINAELKRWEDVK